MTWQQRVADLRSASTWTTRSGETLDAALRAMGPRPRLSVHEWAEEHRVVALGTSPESGRWRSRPFQQPVLEAITDPANTEGVLYVAASQRGGKALALDTPIPTPDGWRTMGELDVGDLVFDDLGCQTRIIATSDVMLGRDCYRVSFDDGSSIVADAEHQWAGHTRSTGPIYVRTTEDLAAGIRFRVPVCAPVQWPERDLPIDPYVFGAWLGDGNSYSAQITADVREEMPALLRATGVEVLHKGTKGNAGTFALGKQRQRGGSRRCGRGHARRLYRGRLQCHECARLHARAKRLGEPMPPIERRPTGTFHESLRDLGVLGNKHIPGAYMRSSVAQRWSLLQGLMDTDGTSREGGKCTIVLVNEKLARGVLELACSLGFKASIREKPAKINGRTVGSCFRISFQAYADQCVFRMSRKQQRLRNPDHKRASPKAARRRTVVSVDPVASVPVKCIAVESESRLYLAGERFIPTHNTEILLNTIGFFMESDPSPQIFVTYSLEMAQRLSKRRLAGMIRESHALRDLVRDARTRDSGNTVLEKEYDGGEWTGVGANSAGGLSMAPKRVALFDEIDRYPPSAGTEGDPIALALARLEAFWNRIQVYVTSPGTRETSRSWELWQRSDRREWHVDCPDCGMEQVLKWAQVHWEKDGDGRHLPETAIYACERCGSAWDDIARWKAATAGRYRATNLFSGLAGFRISALAIASVPLDHIVRKWLAAQGNPEERKVFKNTVLAEWWDYEYGKVPDETGLMTRREAYPEIEGRIAVPAGCALLTAGVDVQDNRFEISTYAWGRGEESWLMSHEILFGDPSVVATWEALDEFLLRPWPREAGGVDYIRGACVDTGGHHTQAAYDFCGPRFRRRTPDGGKAFVFAIKGQAGAGELWPRAPSKVTKKVPLYPIRVDVGKSQVYGRLAIATPQPGYIHLPLSVGQEFCEGLVSEKREQRLHRVTKKPIDVWKLKRAGSRNEPLDCAVYAYAALCALRTYGFDLEREVEQLQGRRIFVPDATRSPVVSSPPETPNGRVGPRAGWADRGERGPNLRDWLRR